MGRTVGRMLHQSTEKHEFLALFLSQTFSNADQSRLVHDYNEKLPAMLKYIIHSVKNC